MDEQTTQNTLTYARGMLYKNAKEWNDYCWNCDELKETLCSFIEETVNEALEWEEWDDDKLYERTHEALDSYASYELPYNDMCKIICWFGMNEAIKLTMESTDKPTLETMLYCVLQHYIQKIDFEELVSFAKESSKEEEEENQE
jgi:hypothetical protein